MKMSNRKQALQILNELLETGVEHLVICPGGRNAPFMDLLSRADQPFKIHSHFDERAASFFALGLAQNLDQPVAVVTTSGTAVPETYSAVVEAYYTETPLVILSADRPTHFRGSGAPQTIEQKELLARYCAHSFDLENENLSLALWKQKQPVHINVCFKEPLVDDVDFAVKFATPLPFAREASSVDPEFVTILRHFKSQVEKPLFVISGSHGFPQEEVLRGIKSIGAPLYVEATSGLKAHPALRDSEIHFPEKYLKEGKIDGVVRIGHVPTHRLWRDLEDSQVPVLHLNHKSFTGLSRGGKVFDIHPGHLEMLQGFGHPDLKLLLLEDARARERMEHALKMHPESEPALLRRLQEKWSAEDLLYIGNSLPIREWDFVNPADKNFPLLRANRGANGIDGQWATALGWAYGRKKSLTVLGDLTCLYDLNAPWFMKGLRGNHSLAVINNSGGMIFDRMFKKEIYLNRHEISFQAVAQLWQMEYFRWEGPADPDFPAKSALIEIKPDAKQTNEFWRSLA